MPAQTVNYQCPACTGPLHFVGAAGKLECDYCGSTYDIAEIEKLYAQKEEAAVSASKAETKKKKAQQQKAEKEAREAAENGWDLSGAGSEWTEEEAGGLRTYTCPSCGAEIVCDQTTAATSCVYCGNPTVVPGQFDGMLKPDYVIPFKLDKESAVNALKQYYKGKKFLPKTFSAGNHIEEIQGVYVPFWLFNGSAHGEIVMEASRSTTTRLSDEEITTTQHFHVERGGDIRFERVPVDGSSKMPDEHMDAIEPFDYSEMKQFSTAYLPGYLADKYDVGVEECAKRADLRLENSTVGMLQRTVTGYDSEMILDKSVQLQHGKAKYALLPVWMLHTKWNNKDYLFAMNGQTGKLIGDLPVSKGKFAAWFAGIAVPLMIILGLLTGLIGG